jgi:hypothetical protein
LGDVLAVGQAHQSDLILDAALPVAAVGRLLHECLYGHCSIFPQVLGEIHGGEVAPADLLHWLEELVEILAFDAGQQ